MEQINRTMLLKIVEAINKEKNTKIDLESIQSVRIVGREENLLVVVLEFNIKNCLGLGWYVDTETIAGDLIGFDSSDLVNIKRLFIINNKLKLTRSRGQEVKRSRGQEVKRSRGQEVKRSAELTESDSKQTRQNLGFFQHRFILHFFCYNRGIYFFLAFFDRQEGKEK